MDDLQPHFDAFQQQLSTISNKTSQETDKTAYNLLVQQRKAIIAILDNILKLKSLQLS